MKKLIALLVVFCMACGSAEKPATAPTVNVSVQVMARGAVETVESVWMGAAQACVDLGDNRPKQCDALVPARDSLIAAAGMLDAWTDAKAGALGCSLEDVMSAVLSVAPALGPTPATQALLADGSALSHTLGCSKDGGR